MSFSSADLNAPDLVKDTWTEDNRDAKYPVFVLGDTTFKRNYGRSNNSMFWEDASYLCAREMSLAYDFPTIWTRKAGMEQVSLSVTGQNLFYITKAKTYTPEYGSSSSDKGGYALPKSVLMGLKVTFYPPLRSL